MITRLNYRGGKQDTRDFVYQTVGRSTLPVSVDLRAYDSAIEQQDDLGSCTAAAVTSAYEIMMKRLYPNYFTNLSKLFVYYHSRLFDDEIELDLGSYLRDSLKSVYHFGACSEDLWPYNIDKFDVQPSPRCYLDASKRRVSEYSILFTNSEIKEVLSTERPVVVGMEIFYAFMNLDSDNYVVPMPKNYDYSMGFHAVVIVGYDDVSEQFTIKNSWGSEWGNSGYAKVPYDYIERYASERWCFDIGSQGTNL